MNHRMIQEFEDKPSKDVRIKIEKDVLISNY